MLDAAVNHLNVLRAMRVSLTQVHDVANPRDLAVLDDASIPPHDAADASRAKGR